MSRWTSKLNTDEDIENDSIFEGEESIFQDEGKVDQHNPTPISHAEENIHSVPLQQQEAYLAKQPHLRRTLVAVDSPNGILVAKAIRNTQNGHVKHMEKFRKPTNKELADIKAKGVKVSTQPQTVDPRPRSLVKGLLWIGGLGAIAGGSWWAYKKFTEYSEDDED